MIIDEYVGDYQRLPINKLYPGDIFAVANTEESHWDYYIKTNSIEGDKVMCINLETGHYIWISLKHGNLEEEYPYVKCTATLRVVKERN